MKDQWTDRLSEYLDGELAPPERTTLEAHLASCDGCRTTLDELRRVVTNARALDDRPPTAALWPDVAARIGLSARSKTRPVVRRFSFTTPQLAAASVVLALLSGGTAWLLGGRRTVATPAGVVSERVRAIRNAQSALAADPANSYLNLHLAQEMRRKLELLRQAATLAGARS